MDFVNLHNHSEYSLLDGMISPEEMVDYAKENEQKAIAITDHGKMGGFFKMLKHGKEKEVKPLIGVEVYMVRDINFQQNRSKGEKEQRYHLTLIAKNKKGMKDLFELTSKSHTEGFYYRPRVNMEWLKEFSENLIVMSGCIAGVIPQYLLDGKYSLAKEQAENLNSYFNDFYMELQPNSMDEQKKVNRGLMKIHNETGIPLVATTDAHYLKEQQESHKVLLGINSGGEMWEFSDDTFYLMTGNEIFELFKQNHPFLPEKLVRGAIKNTVEISDKCDWIENERLSDTLPNPYPELKDKEEEFEFLEELCEKGWEEKNMMDKKDLPEYQERLDRELTQIKKLGFVRYFLLVHDLYENFVKPNDLMYGTGRGSSAGSLVCCLLDITTPDPIKYGLMFERFISPNRVHEPDVDMDFEDKRREEVKEYFIEKYGREYVADIGTYGTMKGKQVLRDVSRVFDIPKKEVDKVSNFIIQRSGGDARASNTMEDTFQEFDECKKFDARHPEVLKHAKNLEGRVRHAGTHAAGVIVSNVTLADHTPLEVRGGQNGNITTALDWRETDKQGFLKMDLLGLKTLSIIKGTIDQIKLTKDDFERYNIDLDFPENKKEITMKRKHLVHVDYEDERILDEFRAGDAEGVFQFNSVGMSDILKEMKVKGFEDLVALNALYRPGGMRCIGKGTEVQKGAGSNVYYKKIEDVYNDWENSNNLGKAMKKVASLNLETGEIESTKLLNVEYAGEKKVYNLKCLHYNGANKGHTPNKLDDIKASENHKFLCYNENNEYEWKKMKNIKVGDYVAVKQWGKMSSSWDDRRTGYEFSNTAYRNYKYECVICGWDKYQLDTHHIDGDKSNNSADNLCFVCPNHHREVEFGSEYSEERLKELNEEKRILNSSSWDYKFVKVREKVYEGVEDTYDMEVDKNHNFIAGGFIVHNSGIARDYIERRNGEQEVEQVNPIYDRITEDTQGLIVYQEQVMKIFAQMANRNAIEVNKMREKVAKSHGMQSMQEEKKGFIEGCVENDIDREFAEDLFKKIAHFGSYAFNRCISGRTELNVKNKGGLDRQIKIEDLYDEFKDRILSKDRLKIRSYKGNGGFRSVKRIYKTGTKEVYKLKLAFDNHIYATKDHKFLTDLGWKKLGNLTMNDFIYVWDNNCNRNEYKLSAIDSIKRIGKEVTYDLEVYSNSGIGHNYIANGIVTHNSHAIVYTQIAYWTQWLKTFFPLEFYIASLNNEDDDDKVRRLLGALEKKGYRLLLPHINKSKEGFRVEEWDGEKAIRFGLRYIKGIGETTANEIVKHQPYEDEEDIKTREGIKRRTFHKGIRRLLREVDAWVDDDSYAQEELEGLREFLAAEELLPLPVLGKNIKKAREMAKNYDVDLTDVKDIDFSHNDFVYLCGVFNGANYARVGDFGKPSKYSKWEVGDRYVMMDLQDGTAHMRVKFNPKKYQEYKDKLRIGQKVLIHGRIIKDIKMVFIDFMIVLSEEKIKEHKEKYGEE